MRNAGRVLGALLCTAALAGSALALRVVPGGRVLALLFCSNPQPHTAAHGGTGSHPGPNHYYTAGGADDSAHP